jgi:hypothetical protein
MWYGKLFYKGSTLANLHSLRCIENLETRIFWARIMTTKEYFFPYASFTIKDGSKIRLWEDKWIGDATLRENIQEFTTICVVQK